MCRAYTSNWAEGSSVITSWMAGDCPEGDGPEVWEIKCVRSQNGPAQLRGHVWASDPNIYQGSGLLGSPACHMRCVDARKSMSLQSLVVRALDATFRDAGSIPAGGRLIFITSASRRRNSVSNKIHKPLHLIVLSEALPSFDYNSIILHHLQHFAPIH